MDETLTNEEFLALLEETAIETINEFNLRYGADKQLDQETLDYLLAFSLVALLGYNALKARTDIREDIKKRVLSKFDKTYEGIRATTRQELDKLAQKLGREATAQELEKFRRERIKTITNGAYYSTRNELEALLAEQEGLTIVGGITVGDERVRTKPVSHRKHNQKYWRAGNYQPWTDYNCRCTYVYFQSIEEARQAGFSEL